MKLSAAEGNLQIRRVTVFGMVVNLGLSILKGVVGWITGSLGLLADGVHSLSDLLTDAGVLLGIHFGSKEPDRAHPFGHGRMETFSTAFVAIFLALVGGGMIYEAARRIVQMHSGQIPETITISSAVLWVALLSVVAKELLYQATKIVAIRSHSAATYANAWHHRSDAFSSIAVLIGAAAVRFWQYPHGDQLAAIAVGIMIVLVAAQIMGGCIQEFAERSADQQTIGQIEKVISEQPEVAQWHKLRTRRVGREVFLDVHILVNPELKITEAHAVSKQLEKALHEQVTQPVNVIVHIEPDVPEERK